MSTVNPVFKVLAATSSSDVLAKNNPISALAVGQVGVFDVHTKLSVDATSTNVNEVFIAVGTEDSSNPGVLYDINKSAGQLIQLGGVSGYTAKSYMPGRPKIVQVANFGSAKCETEYTLRATLFTGKMNQTFGYTNLRKVFSYKTACCADNGCDTCPQGDCNEAMIGLAANINADVEKLLTASLFVNNIAVTISGPASATGTLTFKVGDTTYTASVTNGDTATIVATAIVTAINTADGSPYKASNVLGVITIRPKTTVTANAKTFSITGAVAGVSANTPTLSNVTITDTAALKTAYPGVCLGLQITTNSVTKNAFDNVNNKYVPLRQMDILVNLVAGFGCDATVTTTQELIYEQGAGYDLKQKEYEAGGWEGQPGIYRTSPLTQTAREGFVYRISASSNYHQLILTYKQISTAGWEEHLNDIQTIIAFPCANTDALVSVVEVFDALLATSRNLAPLADDVAAYDCTSNVEVHSMTEATSGYQVHE